jgi:4-alpha-glucanotransferase
LEGNVELTNEIKEFLLEHGADMVGIAPVDRFNNGPIPYFFISSYILVFDYVKRE